MGISFFTSMGGVSGAFLLLPFQVSFLNFTSPSVSSTNLVYNIVAIPGGVYRYIREGRMSWPLTMTTVIGTLPGVFLGFFIRVKYLPDPKTFKLFVGCVLLYTGARLVMDIFSIGKKKKKYAPSPPTENSDAKSMRTLSWSLSKVTYEFEGETYSFSVPGILLLSLIVGVIGGAYGIGGGAIIAPFIISFYGLPVYTVAGAALMGTFITSLTGVSFYALLGPHYANIGLSVSPDWLLGAMFGLGGFCGMYLGARVQRFVPAKFIKSVLAAGLLFISLRYIVQFF